MARIRIRRCTLRVVRRGGWAWGGGRDEWLRLARQALPALLARRIAVRLRGAPGAAEGLGPIRLTVRCSLADLRGAVESRGGGAGPLTAKLDAALASTIALGRGRAIETAVTSSDGVANALDAPGGGASRPSPLRDPVAPVLRLLQGLTAGGRLRLYLARLAEADLRRIYDALVALRGTSAQIAAAAARDSPAGVDAIAAVAVPDAEATLRRGIEAFAAFAAAARWRMPVHSVLAAVERDWPEARVLKPRMRVRDHTAAVNPIVLSPHAATAAVPHRRALALPFLLLPALARRGTLDALAMAVDTTGVRDAWPALATALAYKVLPSPGRGWRRAALDHDTAAAFADTATPVADAEIARVGGRLHGALDGVFRHLEIAAAADAEVGFVLWRGQRDTYVVFAVPGLFPVGCYASVAACADAIAVHQRPVYVDAAAPRAVMAALDSGNCRFVTAASPTRHEPWRPVRSPDGRRWWTNDFSSAPPAAAAPILETNAADAERIWPALFADRPAVARRTDLELDRLLSLAAAIALGDIAWNLWREREPPHPLLVLERFGDFDARVTSDATGVTVRVPLGRRHSDLMRHGLLGDLADIPWMGRRIVRVMGG
jgi:hypothetical protein